MPSADAYARVGAPLVGAVGGFVGVAVSPACVGIPWLGTGAASVGAAATYTWSKRNDPIGYFTWGLGAAVGFFTVKVLKMDHLIDDTPAPPETAPPETAPNLTAPPETAYYYTPAPPETADPEDDYPDHRTDVDSDVDSESDLHVDYYEEMAYQRGYD